MIWEIDSTRSQVSFAIRVMSVTTTRGRFNTLRGLLHIDEQNPANSWVGAEVDATSIGTHNRLRDTYLRSNAFFAVKKLPHHCFSQHASRVYRRLCIQSDGESDAAWNNETHHLRGRI